MFQMSLLSAVLAEVCVYDPLLLYGQVVRTDDLVLKTVELRLLGRLGQGSSKGYTRALFLTSYSQ